MTYRSFVPEGIAGCGEKVADELGMSSAVLLPCPDSVDICHPYVARAGQFAATMHQSFYTLLAHDSRGLLLLCSSLPIQEVCCA